MAINACGITVYGSPGRKTQPGCAAQDDLELVRDRKAVVCVLRVRAGGDALGGLDAPAAQSSPIAFSPFDRMLPKRVRVTKRDVDRRVTNRQLVGIAPARRKDPFGLAEQETTHVEVMDAVGAECQV